MDIHIRPSKIHGVITAPPSKSVTHRAIIIASLAKGISVLSNILVADDTKQTIEACRAFGVAIHKKGSTLTIHGSAGKLVAAKKPIHLGLSGTSMRLLTAVAALARGTTTITGHKKLLDRPIADLLYTLQTMGIKLTSHNQDGCPPVSITGGPIHGGKVKIIANLSSQFVSALLLISPFAKNPMQILVRGLVRSTPYIGLTISLMKDFGVSVKNDNFEEFRIKNGQRYKGIQYKMEGDYSSASYFFAAAAITGATVRAKNLNPESLQGDSYLLIILKDMGCKIKKGADSITVTGPKQLKSTTIDMSDCPDIVQTVAAVAAYAIGTTHITNIGHLIHKESDRIGKTAIELAKIGVKTAHSKNSLTVYGGPVAGGTVETHGDHRMAMSMAIAALASKKGVTIRDCQVVRKSYPRFFTDLRKIGVQMEAI